MVYNQLKWLQFRYEKVNANNIFVPDGTRVHTSPIHLQIIAGKENFHFENGKLNKTQCFL